MHPKRHPMHEVLHQEMGIDSFALDGDDTAVPEAWQDEPGLAKSRPAGRQRR